MNKLLSREQKQKHYVDFFDSFTMKNRTELCQVLSMDLASDTAIVEVETPIRKRLKVPLNCLQCKYTGFRLGNVERELEIVEYVDDNKLNEMQGG